MSLNPSPARRAAPVSNLSLHEAVAHAEGAGARWPTETEWEGAAHRPGPRDLHGQGWQWTRLTRDGT